MGEKRTMTGPTRILLTPFEVIGCPKAAMRSPTKESIFSRGLDENVTRLRIGDIFFSTRLVEKVGRTGGGAEYLWESDYERGE